MRRLGNIEAVVSFSFMIYHDICGFAFALCLQFYQRQVSMMVCVVLCIIVLFCVLNCVVVCINCVVRYIIVLFCVFNCVVPYI